MSRVLTVGTFDLYHAGHVNLLNHCAKIAGIVHPTNKSIDSLNNVTVGLNSDEFVAKYKGKKPIYSYNEREKLIRSHRYVSDIKINDTKTIEHLLRDGNYYKICDFLVVGSDWATKDYYAQIGVTQEWLDEKEITLCYVPYTQGVSTSQLKERIIGK